VAKKKARRIPPKAKPSRAKVLAKLPEAEEDLLWHMEHGYQLETESLGGNPLLRG
jgi:hypothetical protein